MRGARGTAPGGAPGGASYRRRQVPSPAPIVAAALLALVALGAAAEAARGPAPVAGPERRAGPIALAATTPAPPGPARPAARAPLARSRALGAPWAGRLEHGVQLPSSGPAHVTWDPVLGRRPNRHWRRWGHAEVVAAVDRVARARLAADPGAPRLVIGDISRPGGGDFGPRWGLPGHRSHQSGLDVDVYYPREDGLLEPPTSPVEVDRAEAQRLVDAFLAEGAEIGFTGPSLGLSGPPGRMQALAHHDNHLHVRFPGPDPPGAGALTGTG